MHSRALVCYQQLVILAVRKATAGLGSEEAAMVMTDDKILWKWKRNRKCGLGRGAGRGPRTEPPPATATER
eukprot:scaffold2375_cov114-Skeletonema_marinoi.AAC.5